jgi:hypothetical protein
VTTAQVSDPGLGVRVGDSIQMLDGNGALLCVAPVAAVVKPADAAGLGITIAVPGGALQIDTSGSFSTNCPTDRQASVRRFTVRIPPTVNVSGVNVTQFVLSNGKLGYLGRPQLSSDSFRVDQTFALAWQDEDALALQPNSDEALAIARKVRRLYYPVSPPCPMKDPNPALDQIQADIGCYQTYPHLADPLEAGPVIRFRLGIVPPTPSFPTVVPLAAGDEILFTTRSGMVQSSRVALNGGALPFAPIPFDWTAIPGIDSAHGNDPVRFVVPYLDDQLLVFSPSGTVNDVPIR